MTKQINKYTNFARSKKEIVFGRFSLKFYASQQAVLTFWNKILCEKPNLEGCEKASLMSDEISANSTVQSDSRLASSGSLISLDRSTHRTWRSASVLLRESVCVHVCVHARVCVCGVCGCWWLKYLRKSWRDRCTDLGNRMCLHKFTDRLEASIKKIWCCHFEFVNMKYETKGFYCTRIKQINPRYECWHQLYATAFAASAWGLTSGWLAKFQHIQGRSGQNQPIKNYLKQWKPSLGKIYEVHALPYIIGKRCSYCD